MKNTKQKEVIINIINNSYSHLDAYGIHKEARDILPNISLGTVYRILKFLKSNNLIKEINIKGISHYDKKDNHYHFICNKCNSIIDIYDNDINIKNEYLGNIVIDYKLVLLGVCKKCQKEVKNGTKRK